jgi:hypothetical protein
MPYTQIFVTIQDDAKDQVSRLEACLTDVKLWMLRNKLQLNDSKTELIHLTSKWRASSLTGTCITVGQADIPPSDSVRDLGVLFDKHLTMTDHVNAIVRRASIGLRYISRLRKFLDKSTTEILVHAFVSSHLDSNNTLLLGLPSCLILKLQRVQNAAARIVCRWHHREHMKPILYDLHWLPVQARLEYKVLLTVYKCVTNLAPAYVADMLQTRQYNRTLRSSNSGRLVEPKFKPKTYGSRAFSVMAPRLWNRLPAHVAEASSVSVFKKNLKTFLFH